MTTKKEWLDVVTRIASEYYDEEEENGEGSFSRETMSEDESGDVLGNWLEDFGIWLQEGGWR